MMLAMGLVIKKMPINLDENQRKAVDKLRSGSLLVGGVGSGKSRTALAWYFESCGGICNPFSFMEYERPLFIITTAKKRDSLEWESETIPFMVNNLVVDSWNNITKYTQIENSYFLFDEQRLVGSGVWVKSFLKIAKKNQWILLTATPGDSWMDYIPVFLANGFYKNRTEFCNRHVVFKRFVKFPIIDRFVEVHRLERRREEITVRLDYSRQTVHHEKEFECSYDKEMFKQVLIDRWNPYNDEPVKNVSEYCYTLRKVVNSSDSRIVTLSHLLDRHPRIIVFYNFDYELDILKNADWPEYVSIAEWNGHKHQAIPSSESWLYLVQYTAGAEGWECTVTDTVVFYSKNYSYKATVQAAGRIDRRNTPYKDLYYYKFSSDSWIDKGINRAYNAKETFNESYFSEN